MNKQIISTVIIWLWLLPIIWFIHSTAITKDTPLHKIEGVISKIECKQKSKRFNGELYIYYEDNKKNISFENEYLKRKNFDKGCIELSKIVKVNTKFTAVTTGIYTEQVIEVVVGSNTLLEADKEITKINNRKDIGIIISLLIGGVLTLGNVIIWFYKLNPDNWVKSSFFQYILYFIAVMAIIRYLFD